MRFFVAREWCWCNPAKTLKLVSTESVVLLPPEFSVSEEGAGGCRSSSQVFLSFIFQVPPGKSLSSPKTLGAIGNGQI